MKFSRIILVIVALVMLAGSLIPTEAKAADDKYFVLAKRFADTMIEHGRDTYGQQRSPLFAVALDRKTYRPFETAPKPLSGYRGKDRIVNGANPMVDENFYQMLYALSRITGQPRYAAEADAALKWFFENCQSPKGLMAWGEHQGWDFFKDAPSAPDAPHEFLRPWVLGDRTAELAPEAMHRLAVGLWEHQIGDHETGEFSRHAMAIWDVKKPSGRKGAEFPRHGGFYIAMWASEYQRSQNPLMLHAIEVLVDSFLKRRHPDTGAIPADSGRPDMMWPPSNISLAIDLSDAATKVPSPLADKLRDCAAEIDRTYLKLPHTPGPGGKGFVQAAATDTLLPGEFGQNDGEGKFKIYWAPYSNPWGAGYYGEKSSAIFALHCAERYRQTGSQAYRKLVLECAETYLTENLDMTPVARPEGGTEVPLVYPAGVAPVITLQAEAYRMTGDSRFLKRAEYFADKAIEIFLPEDSFLPRAGSLPRQVWYEALSGGADLMMALLDLSATISDPKSARIFTITDR